MLLIKNGHFIFRNISIKLPDGFYLHDQVDAAYSDGVEFSDEHRDIVIIFNFFEYEEGFESFAKKIIDEDLGNRLGPIRKIESNGLVGYEQFHKNGKYKCYSILFGDGGNNVLDFFIRTEKYDIFEVVKRQDIQDIVNNIKRIQE